MKYRKGGILSIFVLIIVVLVLGIGLYFMGTLNNEIFHTIDNEGTITSEYGNATIQSYKGASIPIADTMYLVVFFGMIIGLIITAIYTDMHPVVIGVFLLIFLIFGVGLSMFATDTFDEVGDSLDPEITGSGSFSFTKGLMGKNFPLIIGAVFLIFIIILYAKGGNNQGNF